MHNACKNWSFCAPAATLSAGNPAGIKGVQVSPGATQDTLIPCGIKVRAKFI